MSHSPTNKIAYESIPQLIYGLPLNLYMLVNFSCILLSADFFEIISFENSFQESHRCQTVLIQIRPDMTYCRA